MSDRGREPLEGGELLAAIEGAGAERVVWEAGVASEIRGVLEGAASSYIDGLDSGVTVRVNKARLGQVLGCEGRVMAELDGPDDPFNPDLVRGVLMDQVTAQVACGIELGPDPFADALAGAAAAGRSDITDGIAALDPEVRHELAETVNQMASDFERRWPSMPAGTPLRWQERMEASIGGGRVKVAGRADLVVGAPGDTTATKTIIDFKSGKARPDHRADAMFYAVLETLRSGVAPFQTATYYLADGRWDAVLVTPSSLFQATDGIADGLGRLVRLAGGHAAELSPSNFCPWCRAIASCEDGQAHCRANDLDGPGHDLF